MRKYLISLGLAVSICTAAGAALAAPMPPLPDKTIPKLPVTTIEPVTIPIKGIEMTIDPSLLPDLSTATTSSGPAQIDPGKLELLKPLPLGDIIIPPELLKGPQISDIALSTDGKILQVNWTTDKLATSKVEYGTSDAYGKSLEDKTKVTQHSLLIPAAPGELHLRISSGDALGKTSQSEDIAVTIPDTTTVEPETTTTTNAAVTTTEDEKTEAKEEGADKPEETPSVKVEPPMVQVQTGPSTMTLVGGAVLLLIIGLLAGALLSRGKKQSELKSEQK
jgi:hypothetical protein